MWEVINYGLKIFAALYAIAQLSVIICAALWLIWEEVIRPHLISQTEIEALAADWIAFHNNPIAAADHEYQRATYRSENADQIKWRRIRRVITRELCK